MRLELNRHGDCSMHMLALTTVVEPTCSLCCYTTERLGQDVSAFLHRHHPHSCSPTMKLVEFACLCNYGNLFSDFNT